MHRRRAWITRLAGTVTAIVLAGLTAVPAVPAAASQGEPARPAAVPSVRSKLPWASGVFIPQGTPADYEAFGAWRGAKPDVALLYNGRDTWDHIIKPAWLTTWRTAPHTLVISTAMIPDQGGATLAACARGDYDDKWRTYGRAIQDAGVARRTIIRLGWEFNGLWVPWAATNPASYASCWRRVHRAVESQAPAVLWDWCVNRGLSSVGKDPRLAYPGDRYVDIVGIDSFDGYPPATTTDGWRAQHSSKYGLRFWASFARAHRKGFSVPEWAVYPGTSWEGAGGGDNPHYIARMMRFFRQNADILAYESYFNEGDAYQGGALNLNPLAAEEYRAQVAATLAGACRGCVRPHG